MLGTTLLPAPAAAASRVTPPFVGLGDLSPVGALTDFVQWVSRALAPTTSATASVAPRANSGPQAHFGFGQSSLLAQATGTQPSQTSTPTPPASATPTAGATASSTVMPGTPAATLTPAPFELQPSTGYLVPGLVSATISRTPTAQATAASAADASARAAVSFRAAADTTCAPTVRVTAGPNGAFSVQTYDNTNLVSLYFPSAGFQNARVDFADAEIRPDNVPTTYVVSSAQSGLTFSVSAMTAGQPVTAPFTVYDGCSGSWPTFVGFGSDPSGAPPCMVSDLLPPGGTQYPPYVNGASVGGVHTLTGSYSTSDTNVSIPGRGPSPQFVRTYNSNAVARGGPLGFGWTHNYNIHLARPVYGNARDVLLIGAQGQVDRYTSADGISYTPPAAVFTTLARDPASGLYTATQKDQTVWTFDGCGQLQSIKDRYNNTSVLTYDGNHRLHTVSDPANRGWLTFNHDQTTGLLMSIVDWGSQDPGPRTVSFTYDQGRLHTVTDRENKTTSYGYDGSSARLYVIVDANQNQVLVNHYDGQGRVDWQQDALGYYHTGQVTTFGYNGLTTTVTLRPPRGSQLFTRRWSTDITAITGLPAARPNVH